MSLTSLLVCHDAVESTLLEQALRREGIDVSACTDNENPLQRLESGAFNSVIVDCSDSSTAFDVIGAVRASRINAAALVIGVVNARTNVREVLARGANFLLYRPLTQERIQAGLKSAITMMKRERRQGPRIKLHAAASISYANVENASATILQLSEGGIAIQCGQKLPPSCKVYFQFSLPGKSNVVRLSGEVVWQDNGGRVGIRFADVPRSSRNALKDWLDHKVGSMPAVEPISSQPAPETVSMPLAGLGLLNVSANDRRNRSRHACRLGADIYQLGTGVPNRCTLSDLSVGGCYVEMPTPFASGTRVEIIVRTAQVKLHTRGVVQGSHPGFGMGVKFTLETVAEREHLQDLIRVLEEAQASEIGTVPDPHRR